jgi:hypothetical protein
MVIIQFGYIAFCIEGDELPCREKRVNLTVDTHNMSRSEIPVEYRILGIAHYLR